MSNEIDLRAVASEFRSRRNKRGIRLAETLLFGWLSIALLYDLLTHPAPRSVSTQLVGPVVVFGVFLTFTAIFTTDVLFKWGWPASSCSVDSRGLKIRYRTGRELDVPWDSPRLELTFRPGLYPDPSPMVAWLRWHPPLVVPKDGLESIVASARSAGLVVDEAPHSHWSGPELKSYRIHRS